MPTVSQDVLPSSYEGILHMYDEWKTEPKRMPRGWAQRRGYAFEKMLNALFRIEGTSPRTNYRPSGEEIDGSIVVDFRTHLLEFKWWKTPLSASQLYAFKGKLDGKLTGTIGICISQSGFAEDAIDALKVGKDINMILFDEADLVSVLDQRITFVDAVRKKLRYAAEYGQPFFPLFPDAKSTSKASSALPEAAGDQASLVDVVVESAADEAALRELISNLDPRTAGQVRIWRAGGARNLISLAEALVQGGNRRVALFIDTEDQDLSEAGRGLEQIEDLGVQIVTFEPSFIALLEDVCDVAYYNAAPPTGIREKHARRMARHADVAAAFAKNPELFAWWSSLSQVDQTSSPR